MNGHCAETLRFLWGYREVSRDLQLDLSPSLFLGGINAGQFLRFGTGLDKIPVSIVPDYGGDLGIYGLTRLSGKPVMALAHVF